MFFFNGGESVRVARYNWVLIFTCLLLFCVHTNAPAQGNIVILDQNIKAVAAVSSGRYIKIAWTVKLQNTVNRSITFDVTIGFLNSKEEKIESANKTSTLEAKEVKTVSDTILLQSSVANQIASCSVSVQEK